MSFCVRSNSFLCLTRNSNSLSISMRFCVTAAIAEEHNQKWSISLITEIFWTEVDEINQRNDGNVINDHLEEERLSQSCLLSQLQLYKRVFDHKFVLTKGPSFSRHMYVITLQIDVIHDFCWVSTIKNTYYKWIWLYIKTPVERTKKKLNNETNLPERHLLSTSNWRPASMRVRCNCPLAYQKHGNVYECR